MDEMKKCSTCGTDIPAQAIVCRECSFYQDWRRHLNVGQVTLALMVALLSVVGAIVPPILAAMKPEFSRFQGHPISAYGKPPAFMIMNTGPAAGAASTAFVRITTKDGAWITFDVPIADAGVVLPSSSLKLQVDTTEDFPPHLMSDLRGATKCDVGITLVNFDGSQDEIAGEYDCHTMLISMFRNGQALFDGAVADPRSEEDGMLTENDNSAVPPLR